MEGCESPGRTTGKICHMEGCDEPAVLFCGRDNKCQIHARFRQMKDGARKAGKYNPTVEELEALASANPKLECPHCGVKMNWLRNGDDILTQITLQHYYDGSVGLICYSCNCRDGAMKHEECFSLPEGKHICNTCGEMKGLEEFPKYARAKTGHGGICKKCNSARNRKYREDNHDLCLAREKVSREKNKDKNLEYQKKYYQANKEKKLAKNYAWAAKNKEKMKEYSRQYRLRKKAQSQPEPAQV